MPVLLLLLLLAVASPATVAAQSAEPALDPLLEVVAELPMRPGNPAVDATGRLFASVHPLHGSPVKFVEVLDKTRFVPYPSPAWARQPGPLGVGIVDSIGVRATAEGRLYILDLGSRARSPRLVVWNLAAETLERVYPLPLEVLTGNAFVQDLAVDVKRRRVHLADMGRADLVGTEMPALLTLDLETGRVVRRLAGHPALRSARARHPDAGFLAAGQPLFLPATGGETRVSLGLNPITIDPAHDWVYFSTIDAGLIHRLPAALLADLDAWDPALVAALEPYGPKPSSDGITVDAAGNVYVTDIDRGAIGVTTPAGYRILHEDPRLVWPDGLACGPDGYIYVTATQLREAPAFNHGEDKGVPPYRILRFPALAACPVGR